MLDDFNAKMTELRTKYPTKSVPAMPTIKYDSKTIEATAGYFGDGDTDCPDESEKELSDCDSDAGDEIDFAELFQIFLKNAQEKLDERRYGHQMTYEQTLHNGLAQMNANLCSDEQIKNA